MSTFSPCKTIIIRLLLLRSSIRPTQMSEDSLISSLYPPPPPYVKFFTEENLRKLREYTKNNSETTIDLKEEDKALEFLIPPKKPESEVYRSFGNIWNFNDEIPKLEDMGIAKLYQEPSSPAGNSNFRIHELKVLLKSLLLNILEIVGVMSLAPDKFAERVEGLRTILINIHHLLNEYRPHQSRESLILLLERQIETKNEEIKQIETVCIQVEQKIKSLVELYIDNKSKSTLNHEEVGSENDKNDIKKEEVQ